MPKRLDSKYFYDSIGDILFQQIMQSPEYYLTSCELEIFRHKTAELAAMITSTGQDFDLIELGAGDASKSEYLLKFLASQNLRFTYMPIDISGHILTVLQEKLRLQVPGLEIVSLEGEYMDMLGRATSSKRPKVVMFLGSNIGNMEKEDAASFCKQLRRKLVPGDMALIGFDLKKHPKTILNAYNDKAGLTSRFNLNLLQRINRELNADFDLKQFQHYQTYDPLTGACRSFLVSLRKQQAHIDEVTISFARDEIIYMEVSQKYTVEETDKLATDTGFQPVGSCTDTKGWFIDTCWRAI